MRGAGSRPYSELHREARALSRLFHDELEGIDEIRVVRALLERFGGGENSGYRRIADMLRVNPGSIHKIATKGKRSPMVRQKIEDLRELAEVLREVASA